MLESVPAPQVAVLPAWSLHRLCQGPTRSGRWTSNKGPTRMLGTRPGRTRRMFPSSTTWARSCCRRSEDLGDLPTCGWEPMATI